MNNLNSILLEGNLVKDAELTTTPKGTKVCNLIVASNRYFKTDTGFEKEVLFIKVVTWAKLAEACGVKGKKGRGVRIVGRLHQNRWVDADGNKKSDHEIIAEHLEFRPVVKKEKVEDTLSGIDTDDMGVEFSSSDEVFDYPF